MEAKSAIDERETRLKWIELQLRCVYIARSINRSRSAGSG